MRGHPVFVAQHATARCCRGVCGNGIRLKKESGLVNLAVP
jgi:hypothetical protein